MTTLRHHSKAWIVLVFALGMPLAAVDADISNEEINHIGRENPFGAILADIQMPTETPQPRPISEEVPEMALGSVVLKFLDASSLESVLTAMVQPFGAAAVNEANNSVVFCAPQDKLESILEQIRVLDKPPGQVAIEVLILDVQLDNDTEIGVNWDLLTSDRSNVIYRQNFTSSRLRSTVEDSTTIGDATAFNTLGLGGDFSVISGTVRHVLHMIQEKRDVEILASPRALVVSGRSATIQAVEEIPYQEVSDTAAGGAGALTSTRFKNVGITLQVTAIIADSNNIFLTVDTEQNVRTSQSADGVPVVDTRRASTALSLRDGQTVIIGGLRREEKTREVRQVPLLGDLPIVGNLFKSTNRVTHNSELVVLLSPHIDKGEPLPKPIAARYEAMHSRTPLAMIADEMSEGADNAAESSERPGVRN